VGFPCKYILHRFSWVHIYKTTEKRQSLLESGSQMDNIIFLDRPTLFGSRACIVLPAQAKFSLACARSRKNTRFSTLVLSAARDPIRAYLRECFRFLLCHPVIVDDGRSAANADSKGEIGRRRGRSRGRCSYIPVWTQPHLIFRAGSVLVLLFFSMGPRGGYSYYDVQTILLYSIDFF
jgi:hypothetical protein